LRRAFDRGLQRRVAMKLIHPELVSNPAALARFFEEAQPTAQLQHPHIVPVYDLGRLPDGRLWFGMKEVHGLTWTELIGELHVQAANG
jgi:serine/threonine protein kinase